MNKKIAVAIDRDTPVNSASDLIYISFSLLLRETAFIETFFCFALEGGSIYLYVFFLSLNMTALIDTSFCWVLRKETAFIDRSFCLLLRKTTIMFVCS